MTAFIQLVVAVAATAQLFFQGETVQYEISVTNAEVVDPMMPFCGTATQDLMIPTVTLTLQTETTMDNAPDYCTDQGGDVWLCDVGSVAAGGPLEAGETRTFLVDLGAPVEDPAFYGAVALTVDTSATCASGDADCCVEAMCGCTANFETDSTVEIAEVADPCKNAQNILGTMSDDGYCACPSGFAPLGDMEDDCDGHSSRFCWFDSRSPLNFELVSQSVVAERLEFVLRMSISRDRLYVSIKFGVDAEDCRYPGVNFVKSWDSSTCQDVFHGSIPFSSLTLCGVEFSDSEDGPGQIASMTGNNPNGKRDSIANVLSWMRYDVLLFTTVTDVIDGFEEIDGEPVFAPDTEIFTTVHVLKTITFVPKEFVLTYDNLIVSTNTDLQVLLVGQEWRPNSPPAVPSTAVLTVKTAIRWPYSINSGSVVSPDADLIDAVLVEDVAEAIDCGTTQNSVCQQTFHLIITPSKVCEFNGNYAVTLEYACRDGFECFTETEGFIIQDLNGADICSTIYLDETSSISAALRVFGDDTFTEVQNEYYLGEYVYFEAAITSNDFPVSGIRVEHATAYSSLLAVPSPIPLDITEIATGDDTVSRFSVYLISASFPELGQSDTGQYVIVATVTVSYDSLTRRRSALAVENAQLEPVVYIGLNGGSRPSDATETETDDDTGTEPSSTPTGTIVGIILVAFVVIGMTLACCFLFVSRGNRLHKSELVERDGSFSSLSSSDETTTTAKKTSETHEVGFGKSVFASNVHHLESDDVHRAIHLQSLGSVDYGGTTTRSSDQHGPIDLQSIDWQQRSSEHGMLDTLGSFDQHQHHHGQHSSADQHGLVNLNSLGTLSFDEQGNQRSSEHQPMLGVMDTLSFDQQTSTAGTTGTMTGPSSTSQHHSMVPLQSIGSFEQHSSIAQPIHLQSVEGLTATNEKKKKKKRKKKKTKAQASSTATGVSYASASSATSSADASSADASSADASSADASSADGSYIDASYATTAVSSAEDSYAPVTEADSYSGSGASATASGSGSASSTAPTTVASTKKKRKKRKKAGPAGPIFPVTDSSMASPQVQSASFGTIPLQSISADQQSTQQASSGTFGAVNLQSVGSFEQGTMSEAHAQIPLQSIEYQSGSPSSATLQQSSTVGGEASSTDDETTATASYDHATYGSTRESLAASSAASASSTAESSS